MDVKELLKKALSKSTCEKHKVAVVIKTSNDESILGWNGPSKTEHNCTRKNSPSGHNITKCEGLCAEKRAISYAARKGIILEGATMYMNEWFPCEVCAKMVVEAGIKKIVTPDPVYQGNKLVQRLRDQPYNFELSEKVLREAGVEIEVDSFLMK